MTTPTLNILIDDEDTLNELQDAGVADRAETEASAITGGPVTASADPVVNKTQGDGFESISAAVSEAVEDDTIVVDPGTYAESVTIDVEGLTLEAADEGAILDGGLGEGDYDSDNRFQTRITIEAENVTVSGFTVQNDYNGIWIEDVDATVENNTIQDMARWSLVIDDDDADVINNTIKDQGSWGDERQPRGLFFRAENAFVRNNELVDAGLSFPQESLGADEPELNSHDVDQSNTINGEPVVHFVDEHDEEITDPGGPVFLIDSTDIVVDGVDVESTETGVLIAGGGGHTIKNGEIGGGGADIEGYDIGWRAIFAVDSEDNKIEGNEVINARAGIEVRGGSHNNKIVDNLVEGPTRQGINVRESDGVDVIGNTIKGCGGIGGDVEDTGLFAVVDWTGGGMSVEDLTVENNTFEDNDPHVRDGSGETDLKALLEDNNFPEDTGVVDGYDDGWASDAIVTYAD